MKNNTKGEWLIYGANGYTGNLIARRCKEIGITPVLGGRNAETVKKLADELGFKSHIFSCTKADDVARELKNYALVLHCAGPFIYTSPIMTDACAQSGCSYLDITGEIAVLDSLLQQNERFKKAGIVVIPGVGFDVVPTDCVAAKLKTMLPSATHLVLGFQATGRPSRGTMTTMVDKMDAGSCRRVGGKLQKTSLGSRVKNVRFLEKEKLCVGIPWGDVASAYYTTGIGNIEVFSTSTPTMLGVVRVMGRMRPLLAFPPLKAVIKKFLGASGVGPSPEVRATTFCRIWGEVSDGVGNKKEMRLQTPNGYDLTVESSLYAVKAVLSGKVEPGAWTPSKAFGAEFVMGLPGVKELAAPQNH